MKFTLAMYENRLQMVLIMTATACVSPFPPIVLRQMSLSKLSVIIDMMYVMIF